VNEKLKSLTERYHRQLLLPEIGTIGQERLGDSKVLVVGAGGLGSAVLLYLAAAGVGNLGIADGDEVRLDNLNRQVLHRSRDVGVPKPISARRTLNALNPEVRVVTYFERIDSVGTAKVLISQYDVVVDATDNFSARCTLNRACAELGVPLVHGSVHRFEGQASVFWTPKGPCYQCLFPRVPPEATEPIPVVGPVPGLIGTIQALETLKILLGVGTPLLGRLLIYDGLNMEFTTVRFARRPDCPVCGEGAVHL